MSANVTSQTIADAALAVLDGAPRIATPELLDRLKAQFPDLRSEALGKALTDAGWAARQWRLPNGSRTRGYAPPAARSLAPAEIAEIAPPRPQPQAPAGVDGVERIILSPPRLSRPWRPP